MERSCVCIGRRNERRNGRRKERGKQATPLILTFTFLCSSSSLSGSILAWSWIADRFVPLLHVILFPSSFLFFLFFFFFFFFILSFVFICSVRVKEKSMSRLAKKLSSPERRMFRTKLDPPEQLRIALERQVSSRKEEEE